jgi:hypothetical protein
MSTAPTALTQEPAAPPQDWRTSLPEEMRGDKSFEKFKGVPDLAKSYVEIQKTMGNAIHIPRAEATPEELDKFYARLGRPESADKYELKRPEMAEGAKYDEEMEAAFKPIAYKAGLTPRQAQTILDEYNTVTAKRMEGYSKTMEDGVGKLKTEWGQNYDKNIGLAGRAVKELGGDELRAMLEETGLGNHPVLIKVFAKLGQDLVEEPMLIGDTPPATNENADTIQLKIDAIRNDPKDPFNSNSDSEARRIRVKQVMEMYEQLVSSQKGV